MNRLNIGQKKNPVYGESYLQNIIDWITGTGLPLIINMITKSYLLYHVAAVHAAYGTSYFWHIAVVDWLVMASVSPLGGPLPVLVGVGGYAICVSSLWSIAIHASLVY